MVVLWLLAATVAFSQKGGSKYVNWYNADASGKVFGISTEKTYKEFIPSANPQTVVVAIIDGGTDIQHKDLQGMIWVNEDEIPANGIDDDNNGYIDDVNGWNFIGNARGENVDVDNFELTRIYRDLHKKFLKIDPATQKNNPEYKLYLTVKKKFEEKRAELEEQYPKLAKLDANLNFSDSVVAAYFGKETYTDKELNAIKTSNKQLQACADYIKFWRDKGIRVGDLSGYTAMLGKEYNFQYNLDFDPRNIVGDDWWDNSNPYYGNNDVVGPDPGHGTFVAGCVGAVRGNGIGADGVAANVRLMIIRVVPDGDERDKDVANAIRYAADNGARIINMSFGKAYSPQKKFVDAAVRYAGSRDVLLVHAAGNDAENNDSIMHYPEKYDSAGNVISNCWISVGASSMKRGKELAGDFSNYGQKTVDVFAPGVDIFGLKPADEYEIASGTSMACPVVSGLAAVLRGCFPELTAPEIRDIIIKSAAVYTKDVYLPAESDVRKLVPFTSLSVSGGVVNLYSACQLAKQVSGAKAK